MRNLVFTLAAGAAITLSGPAFAQMASIGPGSGKNNSQYLPEDRSLPSAYVKKVTALSYRTLELRSEDGGKLTPEHRAELQQELNQLKHDYHVGIELRIKA
jgi:hypothetical protein